MDISQHRHPSEPFRFAICAAFSVLAWAVLLIITFGTILIFAVPFMLMSWMLGMFFKATVLGNAVKVSDRQYPELNAIIQEVGKELGLETIPTVFVVNGQGAVNAFAVRFLGGRYVLLLSNIVDLMLRRGATQELKTIIAHELAHHAAGHVSIWRSILILPASFIPYLGFAYSRACEFTADRIALALVKDLEAAKKALVVLAHGSESLADRTNIQAFIDQEKEMPTYFGTINELYSTHPRLTRRVLNVIDHHRSLGF